MEGKIAMNARTAGFGVLLAMACTANAQAADLDKMDGLQLYNKECSVCHGNMAQKTGGLPPARAVQVAMSAVDSPKQDFPVALSSEWGDLSRHEMAGTHLAVVPIYGPPLAGVVGRTAGTFEGYTYSKSFLEKMNGVAWDEAKLDNWIKSSQTMVPGSYMFYSMKKAELRGRIIEYLKAQAQ
jgi:cytochrome c2